MDVLISSRYTWIDFSEQVSRRFDSGSGIIRGLFLLYVAFYFGLAVGFGRSFAGRSDNFDRFQVRNRFGSSWNWFGTESS